MGGTCTDRLDAIAAGFKVDLAGHLAVADHQVALLGLAASNGRAGQHDHILPPRHRTHLAGDGTATWQCHLKTARHIILGDETAGRGQRKRDPDNSAHSPGAHAQSLADIAARGLARCPVEEPCGWWRFLLLSSRLSDAAGHDQRERH